MRRLRFYLKRRDGCCGIVNRDVVKLEVDLHCEKKPPRFPFPAKPKQTTDVWDVDVFTLRWNRRCIKGRG